MTAVQVKTADALKAHLSHVSTILSDCSISIERMALTENEIDWIEKKVDAQIRHIERIRAHARLQRKRRSQVNRS